MMSLLLAPLTLSAAEPVAEAPVDQEIAVIGNRLRNWRGQWAMRKGRVSCETTCSSGDKAVDAIGCDAMVQCVAPIAPRLVALEDRKLPKDELNREANALLQEAGLGECVFARREAGIAALAATRRGKRT